MTTKTDNIKLPPRDHVVAILGDQAIGYVQTWNEKSMREYGAACARAAVEADRCEYLDTLKLARAIVNGHRRDNPPEDSVEADRQEPDAKAVATAFRDRLISALASLEDCYLSRESIETAAEDVLHSFTASAPVAAQPVVTDEMVTRFLGWKLPQDFAPGAGISFKSSPDPLCWPIGTDLFTDPQARAMLEYVLTGAQK